MQAQRLWCRDNPYFISRPFPSYEPPQSLTLSAVDRLDPLFFADRRSVRRPVARACGTFSQDVFHDKAVVVYYWGGCNRVFFSGTLCFINA